jgi:hypothetical protein
MIVVVAIVGLIVGISFPAISSGLDSVRMVSATDSVAALLNSAVTWAERRQRPVELVVSPREGKLAIYSADGVFHRELELPDGILVENVLPAADELEGVRHIMFVPGGAIPGVGIQLVNRRDAHRTVRLDPMTGFPRVEGVVTR